MYNNQLDRCKNTIHIHISIRFSLLDNCLSLQKMQVPLFLTLKSRSETRPTGSHKLRKQHLNNFNQQASKKDKEGKEKADFGDPV